MVPYTLKAPNTYTIKVTSFLKVSGKIVENYASKNLIAVPSEIIGYI